MSWPGHIKDVGGIRTQFHHMIDIVPTILEATGIQAPATVNGIAQKPIEGVSMAYTFDKANANAPSQARHAVLRDVRQPRASTTTAGSPRRRRPRRRGSWGRASCPDRQRLQVGALQHRRGLLGEQRPRREGSRQAEGDAGAVPAEAAKYNVLPLDNSGFARLLTPRPSAVAGRTVSPTPARMPGIPVGNAPSILDRDYTITAEVTIPEGGARGNDRDARRPLRRLRPLPAQGQAGVRLQPARSGAIPLGRRRRRRRLAGRFAQAGQAHDRVRLQVRRPGPGQGRHRRALGRRQGVGHARRSSTRSRC